MAVFYNDVNNITLRPSHGRSRFHILVLTLVFIAAYFTTITVKAQPQDAMVFNANQMASVTGTVKSADEDFVIVTSAGKDIKIMLNDVNLKAEADTLFTPGMMVTADGRMKGDDFGTPIMKARAIIATAAPEASQD